MPRHDLVSRLLSVEAGVPLALLMAPSGYGKTTTLRQCALASARPVAWLQLTEAHDDPLALLSDLLGALHDAAALHDALAPPSVAAKAIGAGAAVAAALDELRRMDEPVLVVVDDLQRVRRRAALDLLIDVAEHLPPGSRVALASQRWPRSRLARLRRDRHLLEIGSADLAFSSDETVELLVGAGIDPAPSTVRDLVVRSEGWPAGLALAVLALRRTADPAAAAHDLAGDEPDYVQYFMEEVLANQSVDTVHFLLRTAVLEHMSASLCDAALNATGSAAWIDQITALNLFVVPEDDHGEWFRYHRLFAEMLRSELGRREPGEDLKILRRAGGWYEDQARPEDAIDYALAGHAEITAARLIATNAQRLNSQGRLDQVRLWVDTLHERTLEDYPPVAITATWLWALLGDAPRARQSLQLAEGSTFDGPLPDGSASLDAAVARARAALSPDGVDVLLADAERAVRLEPRSRRWATLNTLLVGVGAVLTGDSSRAAVAFERAARFSQPDERPGAAFSLAQRALLASEEGDWPTAGLCSEESLGLLDAPGLSVTGPALATYLACALVALHGGDTERAWTHTRHALTIYRRPSPVAFPWLAAQSAILLGSLLLELGEVGAAEKKATEARRHMTVLRTTGTLAQGVDELVEAIGHTRRRAGAQEGSRLTRAELRVLQLLPTHLTLSDIADQLVVSRNTVKSQVSAIYRKLDAATRTDAVHRAHELGLLDPQTPLV